MLKKSLLASIAFISINPIAAHEQTPVDAGAAHGGAAHGGAAHSGSAPGSSNCPPCPCGGVQGWVLIPAGPGTPCHQGAGATTPEEEATPHHHQPAAEHHPEPVHHPEPGTHHKPPMHPEGRTPEQQKLEEELHPITPHLFLRANPNSPTPNKKEGEWGKELNGKVYFRHLGNWVYDPSVKPTDIISTGVKDKVKMFGGGAQAAHADTAHGGSSTEAHKEAVAETTAPEVPTAPPPPATKPVSRGGWTKDESGHWVRNTPPDALGTTARPNTVDANGQPIQGSFNRAQTGMTGGPAPQIDASANSPQPAGH